MSWNNHIQSSDTGATAEKNKGGDSSRDVRAINMDAGRMIADSMRPTFGPVGANKLLVDGDGNLIVTNNGATILGELSVETDMIPVVRLLTELALSHNDRYGDGTKAAIILAGELLSEANTLLEDGLHPPTIIDGFDESGRVAIRALESIEVTQEDGTDWIDWVAKTALAGRGGGELDVALVDLIVEAVRTVEREGYIALDDVSTVTVRGGTVLDSSLIRGLILDTEATPALPSMPRSHPDAGVLCFSTLLDPFTKRTGKMKTLSAATSVTDPSEIRTWAREEHETAERLVRRLKDLGIDVIVSKENISDTVLSHLADHDILAFEQMADESVDRVAKATGASVVSTVSDIDRTDLGWADMAEFRGVGRREFLVFEGCEDPQTVSLLLRGGTIHTVDETERSVNNALQSVRTTLEYDSVVPGGGASEIAVARRVKSYAKRVSGQEQLAISAFAGVIEKLPVALGRNMGLNPIDSLTELRNRHDTGQQYAGIVHGEGVVEDVFEYRVIEPFATKRQVILGAIDVAKQTLRIDDVIPSRDLNPTYTDEFRREIEEDTDIDI